MVDKVYCLYRKWNPDLVIVANAIGYTQRILVKLAKTLGVKSVTAPHGWVGDIDEYEFESDLFLAWGELSKKQLIEEFNKSAENIAAVGPLQFDRFIPLLRQFRDAKEIKDKLKAEYMRLNPAELQRNLRKKLAKIKQYRSVTVLNLATTSENPTVRSHN